MLGLNIVIEQKTLALKSFNSHTALFSKAILTLH